MPIECIQEIDVLFVIDATGSMSSMIRAVHDHAEDLARSIRAQYVSSDVRFGAVCFRDPVDSPEDIHEYHPFNSDVATMVAFLAGIDAHGGGDVPEDWCGPLEIALNTDWRNGCNMIIMITDAPAHGKVFCGYSNHDDQEEPLINAIRQIAARGISFAGISLNNRVYTCFQKCQEIYLESNGFRFCIESMPMMNARQPRRTFSACLSSSARRGMTKRTTAPSITREAAPAPNLGETLLNILNKTCTEVIEARKA